MSYTRCFKGLVKIKGITKAVKNNVYLNVEDGTIFQAQGNVDLLDVSILGKIIIESKNVIRDANNMITSIKSYYWELDNDQWFDIANEGIINTDSIVYFVAITKDGYRYAHVISKEEVDAINDKRISNSKQV